MNWIICDYHNILLILCGIFYSVLCIFSIVTGLMYASGKKKRKPLRKRASFFFLIYQISHALEAGNDGRAVV